MHLIIGFVLLTATSLGASMTIRNPKNLPYFDYLAPEEYDYEMALNNDISRTLPKKKPLNPYNSPIYYIRLPPQPYMFVPGLGYISQPPPPPPVSAMSPFVSLPVNFLANGKPSNIYQWGAAPEGFVPAKPTPKPPNMETPDSTVHKLDGQFVFNGKPDNMFILRDSYNTLYGDALQNFYP